MSDVFWLLAGFFGFLAIVGGGAAIGLYYLGPADPL